MRKLGIATLALLIAGAVAAPVMAGDEAVTLEGKMICAKCSLKEDGLKACQNVLVVEMEGAKTQYYLAKNEVNTEFGDVCTAAKPVRVTGSVSEKDGKKWIAATEIAPVEKKG